MTRGCGSHYILLGQADLDPQTLCLRPEPYPTNWGSGRLDLAEPHLGFLHSHSYSDLHSGT